MGFADDTAVHDEGDGRYTAEIRDGWDIAGNANGGYLLSMVARVMRDASGRPDPVSVTGHYLAPGHPGAAEVRTDHPTSASRSWRRTPSPHPSWGGSTSGSTRKTRASPTAPPAVDPG